MNPRRWFVVVFGGLLIANLVPLTAEYLPFTDLQGHIGVVGALAQWDEPEARIPALYIRNPNPVLASALFEHVGALLGRVLPVAAAANLYLALFCVLGLPLALLFLLRAYGRDERLALLIFPLVYHRCLWYGFVNYVAAVPLVLLGLGLLRRLLDAPAEWRRLGWALAGVSFLIVEAHIFGALVLFGLCLVVLVIERPPLVLLGRVVVALTPGLLLLGYAMTRSTAGSQLGQIEAILTAKRSASELARLFYEWSINGIQTPLVHVVMGGLGLGLLGAALWGLCRRKPLFRARRVGLQPLALLVVTATMFVVLPMSTPTWWAINVRLIPLVFALGLLAIPRGWRPTPAWLLAPGVAAGLLWGSYLGWDFHHWYNRVEMAGFDQALDAIPRGRQVQGLYPLEGENHYAHFPMAHIGGHYMARRGGMLSPLLDYAAVPDEAPIRPRPRPAGPAWGNLSQFRYRQHGRGWEYFLVKLPAPGHAAPRPPFADAPPRAVALIAEHGLWQVYRNQKP